MKLLKEHPVDATFKPFVISIEVESRDEAIALLAFFNASLSSLHDFLTENSMSGKPIKEDALRSISECGAYEFLLNELKIKNQ